MIGSTTPPATIEPISEASVRVGVRCAASQTLTRSSAAPMPPVSTTWVTSKPEPDRKRGDHDEAAEHHEEEGDDRMAVGERGRAARRARLHAARGRPQALLPLAAGPEADRRMCFDGGDDGYVAHLDTF